MAQEQNPQTHSRPQPLYAVTIHQCAAGGDLQQMKNMVKEAEEHIKSHGNVGAALELLKGEIAKLEHKHK
jgi:hypothetical protein